MTTTSEQKHRLDTQAERDGFRTFLIVLVGQLVSSLGSSMTTFALGIWILEQTGSITLLSLVVAVSALPALLLSPVAGALVDRYDRRMVMMLSDSAAALTTLVTTFLVFAGRLELWNLYILAIILAVAKSLHAPASTASVPLLVKKGLLGRASGLASLGNAVAAVAAPVLAAVLMGVIGLGGVLIVDLSTFAVAVITLAFVRIPRPRKTEPDKPGDRSLIGEIASGWRYLRNRPGLVGLLLVFACSAFVWAFAAVLYLPLMLAFTTKVMFGATFSFGALGMILGSTLVTLRGVPQRKVFAQLTLTALAGVMMAVTGVRPLIPLIGAALFFMTLVLPIAQATDQVLWQTKIAPEYQGRVFALRRMIVQASAPVAYVLAGTLADRVFEPLLAEDGALADSVGRLIGTGTGRGVGLMIIVMGLVMSASAIAGLSHPRIRHVEAEIPDSAQDPPPVSEASPVAVS